MKKVFWGAVFVIPSLLLPLVPALAQLDPTNSPRLSGPIASDKPKCSDRREVDGRTDPTPKKPNNGDGTVMARVRLCSWLLTYDPEQDGNVGRDFGAAWVQTSIDGRNGYCVRSANTKIRLPLQEGLVSGRTPHKTVQLDAPRRKNVGLTIAPRNSSGTVATVAQHFRLLPRELNVLYKDKPNGRLYSNLWRGRATDRQTLSFAAGVKMSWLTENGSPSFLPRLHYRVIVPNAETPRVCG